MKEKVLFFWEGSSQERDGEGVVWALESMFAVWLHLVLRKTISVSRAVSLQSQTKIILKQILTQIVNKILVLF